MPDTQQLALDLLVAEGRTVTGGSLAAYIPELAAVDPELVAAAVVGPAGRVIASGDTEHRFTIQSISKAFAFALALQEHGRDAVLARVGVEPSGQPFNALSFESGTGRPVNPMINAGAIATTALAAGRSVAEKAAAQIAMMSACAGRHLDVDEEVFASEAATGDRNRAIAHLLAADRLLDCPADTAAEAYFRQCAVLVDVRDVATMAATLAFAGRNPVTDEQVMSPQVARDVVSVMTSCGMYDSSGSWLLRVGLPAKSGVGGAIIAVDPGEFGVAVFSPPLDGFGNSVRGVAMLELASRRLGLHMLDRRRPHTLTTD